MADNGLMHCENCIGSIKKNSLLWGDYLDEFEVCAKCNKILCKNCSQIAFFFFLISPFESGNFCFSCKPSFLSILFEKSPGILFILFLFFSTFSFISIFPQASDDVFIYIIVENLFFLSLIIGFERDFYYFDFDREKRKSLEIKKIMQIIIENNFIKKDKGILNLFKIPSKNELNGIFGKSATLSDSVFKALKIIRKVARFIEWGQFAYDTCDFILS